MTMNRNRRLECFALLVFVVAGACGSKSTLVDKEVSGEAGGRLHGETSGPAEIVFAETKYELLVDSWGVLPAADQRQTDYWQPTPCTDNDECPGGYCLQVDANTGESFCTIPCVEECPGDWECKLVYLDPPDLVSLCIPPTEILCAVCDSHVDCLFAGALCHTEGEAYGFCGRPCGEDSHCPEGFSCIQVETESGTAAQCLPREGACCAAGQFTWCDDEQQCTDDGCHPTLGCTHTPREGPCDGDDPCLEYLCQEGQCVGATIEGDYSLDGVDDDCDGQTDEDALTSLSLSGFVWQSGGGSAQGMGLWLDGDLSDVRFVGETWDGKYRIRSGLPTMKDLQAQEGGR